MRIQHVAIAALLAGILAACGPTPAPSCRGAVFQLNPPTLQTGPMTQPSSVVS